MVHALAAAVLAVVVAVLAVAVVAVAVAVAVGAGDDARSLLWSHATRFRLTPFGFAWRCTRRLLPHKATSSGPKLACGHLAAPHGMRSEMVIQSLRFLAKGIFASYLCLNTALVFGHRAPVSGYTSRVYESPVRAMNALGNAVAANDEWAMRGILGANFRDFIPPVDAEIRVQFLQSWRVSHEVRITGNRAIIFVGDDGWTLPIPLTRTTKGWHFDTRAGANEMRIRRIGRNELSVMEMMLAVRDAQLNYSHASIDTPTVFRTTAMRGRRAPPRFPKHSSPVFYHGYYFKMLAAPSSFAREQSVDYPFGDREAAGVAILAWPAKYRDTGVMSFMVSQDGQLYERDLGSDTAAIAVVMNTFNLGYGWRGVSP